MCHRLMRLGLINLFLQTGWTNINTEHNLFDENQADNSTAALNFPELCQICITFLKDP